MKEFLRSFIKEAGYMRLSNRHAVYQPRLGPFTRYESFSYTSSISDSNYSECCSMRWWSF